MAVCEVHRFISTYDINLYAKWLAIPGFLGVFAADQLPQMPAGSEEFCFICNTDTANKPGVHWLAFIFTRSKTYEFFDSYGLDFDTFYSHIKHAAPWLFAATTCSFANTLQMQPVKTDTCGDFCLYFLHQRLCAHAYKQYLRPRDNEEKVNTFLFHKLPHRYCGPCSFCPHCSLYRYPPRTGLHQIAAKFSRSADKNKNKILQYQENL